MAVLNPGVSTLTSCFFKAALAALSGITVIPTLVICLIYTGADRNPSRCQEVASSTNRPGLILGGFPAPSSLPQSHCSLDFHMSPNGYRPQQVRQVVSHRPITLPFIFHVLLGNSVNHNISVPPQGCRCFL